MIIKFFGLKDLEYVPVMENKKILTFDSHDEATEWIKEKSLFKILYEIRKI